MEEPLTTRQRVAVALFEDALDAGRSREDAVYLVRQRWRGYDVDEPEEFWEYLREEKV